MTLPNERVVKALSNNIELATRLTLHCSGLSWQLKRAPDEQAHGSLRRWTLHVCSLQSGNLKISFQSVAG